MTLPVFTSRTRVSDFLKTDPTSPPYVTDAGTIKNVLAALAAGDIQPGMPLKKNGTQWETLAAANISDADGWYIDPQISEALANNATSEQKYTILIGGPAVVNVSVALADPVGAAIAEADVIAALAAVSPPIRYVKEGSKQTTQTT